MPRSRFLPLPALACLLLLAADLSAACTRGVLFHAAGDILSFAAAPSGEGVATLLRITPLTEAGRYAVEYRDHPTATPRRLYETAWPAADLAGDDAAVYLAERIDDGRTLQLLRLEPHAARVSVLASFGTAQDARIHAGGDSVYVLFTGPSADAPARIVRVPAEGGEAEPVVAWTGFIVTAIDSDASALYYALQDFAGVSTIYRYDKSSRGVTYLHTTRRLRSLAAGSEWLYVATDHEIVRLPAVGGGQPEAVATLQPLAHETNAWFEAIDVADGRLVARQGKGVPRGCANDLLVQYAGGTASLLSSRAGAFALDAGGALLHAPRECFIVAPRPPFVFEQFCLALGKHRAARH